jgi:hypothetical protein
VLPYGSQRVAEGHFGLPLGDSNGLALGEANGLALGDAALDDAAGLALASSAFRRLPGDERPLETDLRGSRGRGRIGVGLPGDERPVETDLSGDAALRESPPKTAATPVWLGLGLG